MRRGLTIFSTALVVALSGPASSLVAGQQNALTSAEAAAGWELLFDGKTLTGWTPRDGDAKWRADNGELIAGPDSPRGFLVTTRDFANFVLKVEFWINERANSGVFLRCPAAVAIDQKTAVEINIFDPHESWPTGSINEVAKIQTVPNTVGKWNTYEITADGPHVVVKLNGQPTVDAQDNRHKQGPIGLQYCCNASSQVKFRNIKIRRL